MTRFHRAAFSILALVLTVTGFAGAAQIQSASIDQIVDRITAKEGQEVNTIRGFRPIIETYIQDLRHDKDSGFVPIKDHYFIGIADLSKGQYVLSMTEQKQNNARKEPLEAIADEFSATYVPTGFLEMIFVDPNGFNRHHYIFEYLHREFLGEVRCLVFDVTPARHSGNGRFKGRIWVEDRDYSIVRFNGAFEPTTQKRGFNLHFDSWRLNSGPGLWLPAYVYTEQTGLSNSLFGHVNERSQTRLWGYARKVSSVEEFTDLQVESANAISQPDAARNLAPIEQQREWEHQANLSTIDRLERAGLVAPAGGADHVVETVLNNLQVTNNLDVQPQIECRVLETSTLELLSIGHTILISRGLLDVLPDEASLAAMLAHELAHILSGSSPMSAANFADQIIFPDEDSLRKFSFHIDEGDEQDTNQKALEIMRNSPYRNGLAGAGLFLRQLQAESKQLTALISPHLSDPAFFSPELIAAAPPLQPNELDQIAALPLGSRIKLDPWDGRVEVTNIKAIPLTSLQEKMPFGVTPFYPYLVRVHVPSVAGQTGAH